MDLILGVDFGTSKIAFVLIDVHTCKIIDHRSYPTEALVGFENPRRKEQSIEKLKKAFYVGIKDMLKSRGDTFLSIGLTGQMHGILGVDREGGAVTDFVTWQDERGLEQGKSGKTIIEEMEERGGERAVAAGYGIVTLYDWVTRKQSKDISCICTLPDFFGMLLAGQNRPLIDFTMAHSIGCFDQLSSGWDFEYIQSLGIDTKYFPDAVPPVSVYGKLKDRMVLSLIHNRTVPISVPIGDNQASFIGSVHDYFSTLLLNIGTGSQISFGVRSLDEIDDVQELDGYDVIARPFIENACLIAGSALSGGVVYTALLDFFRKTGEELFKIHDFGSLWEKMEKLAWQGSAERGLRVYPLFAGKRSNPEARGAIEEISLTNLSPSNLIYGTLKGMVGLLKDMVDSRIVESMEHIVGSGNGMRKNAVLRKIASDLFHREIMIPLHEEEAAIGAAITGAVAGKVFKDFEEAKRIIQYIT